MIPAVQILDTEDGWSVGIPILNTNECCWHEYKEEECLDDVAKRFVNASGNRYCTLRSNICFDEIYNDPEEEEDRQILSVYEVECMRTKILYFMISNDCRIDEDWDNIKHCVCVPHNKLNLIKFYKDYVMTFADNRS